MNLKKFFGLALSCALLGAALTACGQQEPPVTSSGEPAVYTVEFKNGGRVLQTSEVKDGEFAKYEGATPLKNKTPEFSFTFSGWDKDPATTPIHADTTFLAQFTSSKNSYVAKFMNGEDVFATQTIEYGGYATIPNGIPTKAEDAQYVYTFDKWEPDVATTMITEDTVFTAKYTGAIKSYTAIFMNGEAEFDRQTVEYGKKATAPATIPEKEGDAQYTYVFKGWDPSIDTPITGDTTFNAVFEGVVNKYTVKFMNGEDVLSEQQVAYGSMPSLDFLESDKYYYEATWDHEIVAVTGDATYTLTDLVSYAKSAEIDNFEAYSADNLPNYEVKKYGSAWEDTKAALYYEEGEISPLGGAKSGRFHIWNNGVAFRASKDVSFTEKVYVNNFHAEVKAIKGSKLTFRLIALDNSYFDYVIASMPTEGWVSIDMPLAAFKANGTENELGQIVAGMGKAYEKDALALMKSFQVIYKNQDSVGSEKDIFLDNVKFNYIKNLGLNIDPCIDVYDEYVITKGEGEDASEIDLVFYPNGIAYVIFGEGDQDYQGFYVAKGYSAQQNLCGVILSVQGYAITLQSTEVELKVLAIDSILGFTGLAAGDSLMKVTVMNDFEQYEATGVGYDQAHAASERSGMRGDIYADYYSSGSGSTVGGSGWSMMGSTDYAALATEGEGAQANQYADLKSSSVTMRFMSWAAYSESHNKGFRGSTLSLMIKGGATADRTCRIKVYYSKNVTASTQQSNCAAAEFTITAGSDWTEYNIQLDTSKVYYSISITFLVPSGGNTATQRIGVDDIVFHF